MNDFRKNHLWGLADWKCPKANTGGKEEARIRVE